MLEGQLPKEGVQLVGLLVATVDEQGLAVKQGMIVRYEADSAFVLVAWFSFMDGRQTYITAHPVAEMFQWRLWADPDEWRSFVQDSITCRQASNEEW